MGCSTGVVLKITESKEEHDRLVVAHKALGAKGCAARYVADFTPSASERRWAIAMQKYQDSSLEETLSRDDFSSVEEPMREMCVLAGGGGGRNAVLLVCVWLTRAPACRYAMALIQVVYTLHQAGWVHNDLKVGSGLGSMSRSRRATFSTTRPLVYRLLSR